MALARSGDPDGISFRSTSSGISVHTCRAAETAAHLVDHVFSQVPVRQWLLSLPKRLRYFLHHEAGQVNPVLGIFLQEVEQALRSCSPDAPANARLGAVTFGHHFGSALNANLHFHWCILDGVFSAADDGVRFHPAFLTDAAIARVQPQTRRRVLSLFQHCGLRSSEAVETLQGWDHGGFSLNAEVWGYSWDRVGLERRVRDCARPLLAGERLEWIGGAALDLPPAENPDPTGKRPCT